MNLKAICLGIVLIVPFMLVLYLMYRLFCWVCDVLEVRLALFVLEQKFRNMETDEAKACRLITEDIEEMGK